MKVLQIYNQYRSLCGGEETVVDMTTELVEKHGGKTKLLMRSSRGMENNLRRKIGAVFGGFYSFNAQREVMRTIEEYCPDVVHSHNLYPLISPSALVGCKRTGVPVVLSLHNHMLTCPKTDHLHTGKICERCTGGHEIQCVLNNCRENMLESIAYAGRSYFARKMQFFKNNVDIFIALTDFAKQRMVTAGFNAKQIRVLPNMVDLDQPVINPAEGKYVAFAGRMSREKGIETLLDAAKLARHVQIKLAGDGPMLKQLEKACHDNVTMLGRLAGNEMRSFYANARMLILPSECFEMCPLVISEAMSYGLPVVASRIGGICELVDDGETGLLFETGNEKDMADKIKTLWDNPELCKKMGVAGRKKAVEQYGEDTYYRKLASIYDEAIGRNVFSKKRKTKSNNQSTK